MAQFGSKSIIFLSAQQRDVSSDKGARSIFHHPSGSMLRSSRLFQHLSDVSLSSPSVRESSFRLFRPAQISRISSIPLNRKLYTDVPFHTSQPLLDHIRHFLPDPRDIIRHSIALPTASVSKLQIRHAKTVVYLPESCLVNIAHRGVRLCNSLNDSLQTGVLIPGRETHQEHRGEGCGEACTKSYHQDGNDEG